MKHMLDKPVRQHAAEDDDIIALVNYYASDTDTTSARALGSKPESDDKPSRTASDAVDRALHALGRLGLLTTLTILDHNPLTTQGRRRLRHGIMKSGPAYHPDSPHHLGNTNAAKYSGRPLGAVLIIALLVFCLVAEVIMLAVALHYEAISPEADAGVLFRGDCHVVRQWSSALAILVNLLATLIIASGNYLMQCLGAPSKEEVRRAHRNGRSLYLGISSPLNCVYMAPKKTILWWLMGITSIPIHLLFNSAFFSSLQTHSYVFAIMTADYGDPTLWSACDTPTVSGESVSSLTTSWSNLACTMARDNAHYALLDNEECIRHSNQPLVSRYSNLILISTLTASERPNAGSPKTSPRNRYDGLLGYTIDQPYSTNEEPTGDSFFETKLLEFDGLIGMFESRYYQGWKFGYRQSRQGGNITMLPYVDYATWMCDYRYDYPCTATSVVQNASDWKLTPWRVPISGCLSRPALHGEQCGLEYNKFILYVVIACDIIKIIIVVLVLRVEGTPLITIGDAVASFLRNPEPYTKNKCLMDHDRALLESSFFWFLPTDFSRVVGDGTVAQIWPSLFGPYVKAWSTPRKRWHNATSGSRWAATTVLYVGILLCGSMVLVTGFTNLAYTGAGDEWTRGLLGIDPNAVFRGASFQNLSNIQQRVLQVILVNAPQLVLGFLYYIYNSLLTAMHSAKEWGRFATQRKALRVSNPQPGQRSTYWLNLPRSYSIPLLISSTFMHFLLSRSLYLVKMNIVEPDDLSTFDNTIGYSILMLLITLIFIVLKAVVIVMLSFRSLNTPIPLAGTSSLAISATCHHPNDPESEARKPLLWGVTRHPIGGKPGHCSFSSERVGYPVPGEFYSHHGGCHRDRGCSRDEVEKRMHPLFDLLSDPYRYCMFVLRPRLPHALDIAFAL